MTYDDVTFTVLAEYQIFGEEDDGTQIQAREWMRNSFIRACDDGDIMAYTILDVLDGVWGLQLLVFKVAIKMPLCTTYKKQRKVAQKRLNKIVSDTDVNVRWINRLPKEEL